MRISATIVCCAALLACAGAWAQPDSKRQDGKPRQLKEEDRQRLREDMREVYRDRQATRPERPRPMSEEERQRLLRDVEEANRTLRRK